MASKVCSVVLVSPQCSRLRVFLWIISPLVIVLTNNRDFSLSFVGSLKIRFYFKVVYQNGFRLNLLSKVFERCQSWFFIIRYFLNIRHNKIRVFVKSHSFFKNRFSNNVLIIRYTCKHLFPFNTLR